MQKYYNLFGPNNGACKYKQKYTKIREINGWRLACENREAIIQCIYCKKKSSSVRIAHVPGVGEPTGMNVASLISWLSHVFILLDHSLTSFIASFAVHPRSSIGFMLAYHYMVL